MRRLLSALATAALMIGLVAAPAVADVPEEFLDSETFEDVNPCSGELVSITIDSYVSIHEHDGTTIVRVTSTGTISDGYIMEHGRESFVATDTSVTASFMFPFVNPDLGTKFVAQGRSLVVDDEVVFDDFRLECRS